MIGAFVFLGLASAFFIGFLVIRRRLLPPQPINVNLPPSGAKPWKRVRSESLHGNMTFAGESLYPGRPVQGMTPNMGIVPDNNVFPAAQAPGSQTTMADPLFLLPSTNGGFLVPNVGSQQSSAAGPPYPLPTNENVQDISSSATNAVPGTNNPGPITEKVETKPPTRPLNRPIRLQRQEVESAISPPTQAEQWPDRNSEEMLALDDPFLRNTLRQYILRGKLAREQRQQEEEERGRQ